MRLSIKIVLLFLGLPVCLILLVGIGGIFLTAANFATGGISDERFGLFLVLMFVALYSVWTWLVLRRWKREPPRAFEVLPPKK